MPTTRTFFLSTGLAVLISSASAQEQLLPWPQTFVGQADFDFTRADVVDEFTKKKGSDLEKYVVTFSDILSSTEVDPFVPRPKTADIGRSRYSKDVYEQRFGQADNNYQRFRSVYPDVPFGTGLEVVLRTGETVEAELTSDDQARLLSSGNVIDIAVNEEGYVVEVFATESIAESFEKLFNNPRYLAQEDITTPDLATADVVLDQLPNYTFSLEDLPELNGVSREVRENLEEFAVFLGNIIRQASKASDDRVDDRQLRQQLEKIVLQSVVTSPFSYAIINGRRFQQGEWFSLTLTRAKRSADDLATVIDTYMPSREGLPENIYQKYDLLKQKALAEYQQTIDDSAANNADEAVGETFTVRATVAEINNRQVILSILGERYPITINIKL